MKNLEEDTHPSLGEIEKAISAVVESGALGKSKRRERLLRYLADRETSGQGESLKAFSIAIDVFDRDASFEASSDSIVRSEIGRLRDALKLFYAENSNEGYVRIEIPKGTYRPQFSSPQQNRMRTTKSGLLAVLSVAALLILALGIAIKSKYVGQKQVTAVSISELPYEAVRVSVEPFFASGNQPSREKLAFGMSAELVMDLSAYPWIAVVSPIKGVNSSSAVHPDYVLTGSVLWTDEEIAFNPQLLALPERDVVWSNSYSAINTPASVEQSVIGVSREIANVIGSIHGIAPQLAKARSAQASPEGLEAFLCYLGLHEYLLEPTDPAHLEMRKCLLDTIATFPNYGDAWAALAIIYMDEERFERNPRAGSDSWADAAKAIEKSLVYAPTRMPSLNAAVTFAIEAPERNLDEFERYSELLLNLYPRHPPTLFNVGSRLAEFGGNWDGGLKLVDKALELEPNPPSFFHITEAYRAALTGSDKEAWTSAERLTSSTSKSELLLRLVAASRNGLKEEMADSQRLLAETGLADKDSIADHILGRRYDLELERVLLNQLENVYQQEAVLD